MDEIGERDGLARRMGALLAGEARRMAERLKLERARAIIRGEWHPSASGWPDHRETDEQARQLWLALEREASMPQKGWEPDDGQPVVYPTFDLDIDDPDHGQPAPLEPAERARLAGWLALASPMARIVAKALRKAGGSRQQRGPGEDA